MGEKSQTCQTQAESSLTAFGYLLFQREKYEKILVTYQIQVRLQNGFAPVVKHTVRSVRKMSNPLIALFPFLTTRSNPL